MAYSGYDENGNIRTFDLWCIFAGWDGGTIHEAFRYFADMPLRRKDEFCTMLMRHIDKGQILDLENGFAAGFTRARIGLDPWKA